MYKRVIIDGVKTEYFVSRSGDVISRYKHKERHLKGFTTDKGYMYVKLWINNKTRAAFIHRLVATAYIPNPDNKPEVNHKDGVKSHNYDTNLEWVTSKENKKHAKETGLSNYAKLEKSGDAKYTNKQIEKACKLMEENKLTLNEITEKTGVDKDSLYYIRTKSGWKDISSKYKFPDKPLTISKAYDIKIIKKVCKYLEQGKPDKEISKKTGVKIGTVRDIKKHRRWVQVSKDYKF